MTDKLRTYAALVLLISLDGLVQAAEPPAVEAETSSPSTALPEEITVTGQKLFRVLQQQIEEAEDLMYGLFNDFNDDDRYDIHCASEASIGTRIRQRVCRPEFVARAERAVAQDFLAQSQGFTSTNPPPVQAEMGLHYPVLEEKLREAVSESLEFRNAVIRHHELREELQQRFGTYFDDD